MNKKFALIGAGGFAREIRAHINDSTIIPCFVDDRYWTENSDSIFKISEFDHKKYRALIAVGNPFQRSEILSRLPTDTEFFTFIHPSAQILSKDVKIGVGSIVCANSIITTNVIIGDHCHLNLSTTVGHDTVIGNFFTTAPGAKISGNCKIGDRVYIGTNASVKEKIEICSDVTIGLNAGVVKHISLPGTYVGVPAKKI